MSDLTVHQIMNLRQINKFWKTFDDNDKEEIWREYHHYPDKRTPQNEHIVDMWWRTLEDGIKLKRYWYFYVE